MTALTDADLAACDVNSSGRLIAPETHAPAWEMCGADTIRTKFLPGDPENAGVIVAQFWTRPSDENRALMVAAPEMLEALKWAEAHADILPRKVAEIIAEAIAKAEGRDQ